ncbi:MAG: transglycosylase domain-containing protein [Caldilineaceae bacterium]|nr:transglycosylase domain-containing protein [Caldilineaceae bacterium]
MKAIPRSPLHSLLAVFWLLLAGLLLAACNDLPAPPPLPRPVGDVMQDFTLFADPVAMMGPRPAGTVKDAAEHYLQIYQPGGQLPRIFETTHIYDRNGVLLAELFNEGRRTWVSLDQISPFLIDATIATEDSTFLINGGVDARRMVGAAIQNAEAGGVVSGASTITMQLSRELFLLPAGRYEQSMERKSIEVEMARQLSLRFSKNEILEIYLNLVNYGHLTYGPEAAAQVYFHKSAADLTQAEATLLAGIPQQPASFDLFKNFDAAKSRQRVVLDLLVRHGFMKEDEANAIFRQQVVLNPNPDIARSLAPHFTQFVERELTNLLQTQWDVVRTAQGGVWQARRAGLEVTTSLDLSMQRLAEQVVADGVAAQQARYGMSNGALVALDPVSGGIRAMVGSVDFDNEAIDGQVNVAISRRQPGSAIKPILYAAALDDSNISPASIIWDIPTTYQMGAGQIYRPVNYDGRFHGPVSARYALANSYNVPAVRLLQSVGGERMLEQARELGIASLDKRAVEYGPSLSLGAGEVTLLELTGAFRVFANGGLYTPVNGLQAVADSQGRLYPVQPAPVQVISPATAFQLTDILSDNVARTPAFGANSVLRLPVPAAAKTGTTTDFRDNWTVGYTRQLVVGVWTGNSDGTPLRGSSGVAGAGPLWRAFLLAVVGDEDARSRFGLPNEEDAWQFTPPADVSLIDACPPNVTCRAGGEYFSQAWLERTSPDNPIADSVVTEVVVPTHQNSAGASARLSYCTPEDLTTGQARSLVRISGLVGLDPAPSHAAGDLLTSALRQAGTLAAQPLPVDAEPIVYYPDSELELFRLLAWALRSQISVYLGPCADLNYYTVVEGDNWSALAREVGLTVADLQGANLQVLRESGYLFVGDKLLFPRAIVVDGTRESILHTVAEGESWASIATFYNLPLRLLLTVNPDIVRPFYLLRPGDPMVIPVSLSHSLELR